VAETLSVVVHEPAGGGIPYLEWYSDPANADRGLAYWERREGMTRLYTSSAPPSEHRGSGDEVRAWLLGRYFAGALTEEVSRG
jgi:hypothetical protein